MSARRWLGIVAAVQALLAVITWWPSGASAPRPLLDVDRDAITEIEIAAKPPDGQEPEPLVLAREGDAWVVRSAGDYPAQPAKIDELLGRLLDLDASEPVATSEASHNALKVGENEYGRRVTVTADGERIALVLGAATSKSVNVRRDGEDDVYLSSGASEWSFSDAPSSYYDAQYVAAAPADLVAVNVVNADGELAFARQGEAMTLGDLAEGEVADAAAIDRFLRAVTTLRIARPVGREVEDEYRLGDVEAGGARIDWTVAAEDQSVAGGYELGAQVGTDRYAKAVDSAWIVRVANAATERLRDAKRGDFLQASE